MTPRSTTAWHLAKRFAAAKAKADEATADADKLKVLLRSECSAMSAQEAEPFSDGDMFRFPAGSLGEVTVTKSDPDPLPPLDPARFLAAVGPEGFFRFIDGEQLKVPYKAFRAGDWTRAVEAEEYAHNDLPTGTPPKVKAWAVELVPAKK